MIKDLFLHPGNDCEKSSCWSLCKTCLWEIYLNVYLCKKSAYFSDRKCASSTTPKAQKQLQNEWMAETWVQCLKGIRRYFQTPVENWIVGSKEERDTQFGNPWNWHKYQELFFVEILEPPCEQTYWGGSVFFLLSVVNYMSGKPKTLWLDLWSP